MSRFPLFLLLAPATLLAQESNDTPPSLQFTEIMQSNVDLLYVSHNFPDSWIELRNNTSRSISLKNWRLGTSDNIDEAYSFTHTLSIASHDYGVVYCDKKNDHWCHTDFRLESTSKGKLYLWNPDGVLIDSLAYPKMAGPNIGYGLSEDGCWYNELVATPGAANSIETGEMLPSPIFSHCGRILHEGESFTLSISVPDSLPLPEDVRLYVTTDGSMPQLESPQYEISQPLELNIDRNTIVRARLLSAHAMAAMPVTHSYIFHPRQTSLPILSLCTDSNYLYSEEEGILVGSDFNSNLFKDWARPLNIEYFEPDSSEAIINQMGETKSHGVGSLLYSQKSMNLIAHKRFGKKKFNAGTFWTDKPNITKTKTFCIRNGGNRCIDTRFEDAFAQRLFGLHVDSIQYQAYRPVIAYINGEYKGVFGLRERSHKSWAENNLGIDEDNVGIIENFYSDEPLYDEVKRLIDDSTSTYQDFARQIDFPLFVKYLCAEAFATNNDYPHNNVWLWRDVTRDEDPFHPLLKDLDYVSTTVRSNWFNLMLNRKPESGAVVKPNCHKLFIRLFDFPEFRESFLDHLQTYLGDFCKPSVTVPMVEQMRDEIAEEVAATFSIMTENLSYEKDFIGKINDRLIPYCQEWPLHLFVCAGSTFGLGEVSYLRVGTNINNSEKSGHVNVTFNDLPLTEGDYDGACFQKRRFVVDSNDPDIVWWIEVKFDDGHIVEQEFASSRLEITPGEDFGTSIDCITLTPIRRVQMTREVVFNEVMQSNVEGLMYNKDFPDSWIEFYNPTGHTVNMKGWYIGTSPDITKSYCIRHTRTVKEGKYLLFYCDKKDDGWEHTDFRLENSKGDLYLWDAEGQLVDTMHYKKMLAPDVSFGRIRPTSRSWGYQVTATPGQGNCADTCSQLLPDPVFSIPGQILGDCSSSLTITFPDSSLFNLDEAKAMLYVTTDGSLPTTESSAYGPDESCVIHLDHTVTVRARLISEKVPAGPAVTHSYICHPRSTQLPFISLNTNDEYLYNEEYGMMLGSDFDGNCFKGWRRPFNIEFFDPTQQREALINQLGEAGMHGSGSLCRSQKSMNLYAHKRFGKKRFDNVGLFLHKPQIEKTKTFCIRNGGSNCLRTRFDDAFVQLLFAQHVDVLDYLDYRPVIAYINGQYKGVFGLRERSNDTWAANNYDLDDEQITEVESYTSDADAYAPVMALLSRTDATYQDYAALIDMPIFLNYLCCQTYATNQSYPHDNVYMWSDATQPNSKFHFLLKDLDYVSMTNSSFNWVNYITLTGHEAAASTRPESHQLIIRLLSLPEFRDAYLDRMQTYLGDFCKSSVTVPMIDAMRAEIDAELPATFELMTEDTSYERFETLYNTTFVTYCQQRPMLLYTELSGYFNLGNVIPMKIRTNAKNETGIEQPLNIRLNGIPLTEGNFDGASFANRSFTLDAGNDDYGWRLTAQFSDGHQEVEIFDSSSFSFTPGLHYGEATYLGIRPHLKTDLSITTITSDVPDNSKRQYDLLGRPIHISSDHSGPVQFIIHR